MPATTRQPLSAGGAALRRTARPRRRPCSASAWTPAMCILRRHAGTHGGNSSAAGEDGGAVLLTSQQRHLGSQLEIVVRGLGIGRGGTACLTRLLTTGRVPAPQSLRSKLRSCSAAPHKVTGQRQPQGAGGRPSGLSVSVLGRQIYHGHSVRRVAAADGALRSVVAPRRPDEQPHGGGPR